MLRILTIVLVTAGLAPAQIWPEAWHGSKRVSVEVLAADDQMLWVEYGGEASQKATYEGPVGKFTAAAWRLKDSTSALAWYEANRPAGCTPLRGALASCTTPGAQVMAHQNYVLRFEGWRPLEKELVELDGKLPRLRSGGGQPLLPGYLPEKGRVRNSERYVLGVHSLSKFLPWFPAVLAGLEDGAEAQTGKLDVGGVETDYAVFYFHTPQLARVKAQEFEKQTGWLVRRSGPLVAVMPGTAERKASEAILASLEWKAEAVWNEAGSPPPMPDVGGMIMAILELAGVLLVACLGGGILFASLWVYLRRRQHDDLTGTITVIQLRD